MSQTPDTSVKVETVPGTNKVQVDAEQFHAMRRALERLKSIEHHRAFRAQLFGQLALGLCLLGPVTAALGFLFSSLPLLMFSVGPGCIACGLGTLLALVDPRRWPAQLALLVSLAWWCWIVLEVSKWSFDF